MSTDNSLAHRVSINFRCLISHQELLINQGIGEAYIKKLASKFKAFLHTKEKECDYNYALIEEFAVWLITEVYATSAPSSWRIYKNAFKKICEFKDLNKHLDNASLYAKPVKTKRKGRQRKRYLDIVEMRKLLSAINNSSSKYKQILVDWIKATELVGLRPNEWEFSSIVSPDGNTQVLKAYNTRKSITSQEKLPKYRYIPISHFDEHQIEIIVRFMSKFQALIKIHTYQDAFELLRMSLRSYVNLTSDYSEEPTSGISIYSAREQFCLNLRVSLDDEDLIEKESPDIVVIEVAERSLRTLLNLKSPI